MEPRLGRILGQHSNVRCIHVNVLADVLPGDPDAAGDRVGCAVDVIRGRIYFTRNGDFLGKWH